MQENQEPSLEAQEEILLQEAAQADAEGRIIDEPKSIDEKNQETHVDPVKDTNEEADANASEEDKPQEDENQNADKSNSEDGTQSAESSNKTKEDHPKSKQEKEDERRERSWKKLEEAKAEFLREKAQWQAQQASLNSQPNQNAENPQSLAKAFEDIAKKFEDEGDFDKADEARKKAEELRKMPSAATDNSNALQDNQHFLAAWNTNIERAINDFPQMKDPESDFGKTVKALINAPDSAAYFKGRPDGVYIAAQLANMKMTALRVPELEKENASLKEEIKKLRQGVSLPDTGSRSRAGESVPLEKMTLEQQEAYWKRQAELADAGMPTI